MATKQVNRRRPAVVANGVDPARPLLTINEAAAALGVSRDIVYTLMRSGELTYTIVSKRRRIRPAELDAYLARRS
jgi:excisionase family DNA binding protein